MSPRTTAIRTLNRARPPSIRRSWLDRIRSGFARFQRRSLAWLAGYVMGLAVAVYWAARDPGLYAYVLGAWLLLGAVVGSIAAWLRLDSYKRRMRHDRSGLVSVSGWRIVAPVGDLDPNLILSASLLCHLFDHAQLASFAVRGHRRRTRVTYLASLRTLGREWGRGCGISGRRADALLARLCDYGVVRLVPVGTATAYRLVDDSIAGSLAHLEQTTNATLIVWRLGRDPAWDAAGRPPVRDDTKWQLNGSAEVAPA